jgi:multidrug efflux pump subunit AcrA (membrane-fusion protein)
MRYPSIGRPPAVLLVLIAASGAGCSRTPTAQASAADPAATPVEVAVVQKDSINRAIDANGTLAAVDQVTVSSEADGRVKAIRADLGDRVIAGQVLIQLDGERQQYSLEQQQAVLARTLAQYGAQDPQQLPEIEETPDVKRADADLRQVQQAFDRASELFKRNLISQQDLDDASTALQSKKASYESALQNARNLRASIQASEAATRLASRSVRDTDIRAPFDGFVERRLVNLGELVKAQMPVMAIVRLDPLKVTAEVPEKMAPWLVKGRPVEVNVDAYRDRTFSGEVTRISPVVNTATRAFSFEALVANPEAALKPGTFARVHMDSGKVDEVLTLPHAALQYRYGANRVFVVDGGTLSMREIAVGERVGDRIEVVSGVEAGDRVAVTNVDTLVDGMPVTVTR